jgi:hypothetical protein
VAGARKVIVAVGSWDSTASGAVVGSAVTMRVPHCEQNFADSGF